MENQQLVFRSRQCSSTPAGCGHGFTSKETTDNTEAFPIHSWHGSSWFLPVPSTEISIEWTTQLWCYRHRLKWDGRAEKASIKWLPWMFSTSLQSLAEVYICIRELFRRKFSLYSLLFCINKTIPGTFWGYHVFIKTNRQK
jgi:hypothetical protein